MKAAFLRGIATFAGALIAFAAHADGTIAAGPSMAPRQIAEGLDRVHGEMLRLDARFKEMPDPASASPAELEQRAKSGILFYAMRDYPRASLILFSAVDPPGVDADQLVRMPWYGDAVLALAESLYQTGNYVPARTYFERVLRVPGHPEKDQAIQRLMELSGRMGDLEPVDRYYTQYLKLVGEQIPGDVRYLRGKVLLLGGRADAAIGELAKVPAGSSHDLRARYLIGAALVKQGKLDSALKTFTAVGKAQQLVAKQDKEVRELANIARGRLLYETDRLDESIDAYQEVPYDSAELTTMLYEVTWTYVRRGQLWLKRTEDARGRKLTDEERAHHAKVEYQKAIEQLEALRSLERDTARASDVDLLVANLRLQTKRFDAAQTTFTEILDTYRDADAKLQTLMKDHDQRAKMLDDIIAMGDHGALTVDSRMPAVVARRAASNPDVAKSVHVFRELKQSRAEIEVSDQMLTALEAALSPSNPNRAELFKPLRSALKSSLSVQNTLLNLRAQVVAAEREAVTMTPDLYAKLQDLRQRRAQLEAKVATLPKDEASMDARLDRFSTGLKGKERALHELDLSIMTMRANLVALDTMLARPKAPRATTPVAIDLLRSEVRGLKNLVVEHEAAAAALRASLAEVKSDLTLSGGRGAAEQQLRAALRALYDEEHRTVDAARDPAKAALWAELDALRGRIDDLDHQGADFRARIDQAAERHAQNLMTALAAERALLVRAAHDLHDVDVAAAGIRDQATTLALEQVRRDLAGIVVRADVGLMDVAFARKQDDTDEIGKLQRMKAHDLADLNQAYADLQRDEVQ